MSTAPLPPAPATPVSVPPTAQRELRGQALVAHIEAQIALTQAAPERSLV